MYVIWHEDEFMDLEALPGAISTKDVQQKIAKGMGLQDPSSLPGRKGGEESTGFLRCKCHRGTKVYLAPAEFINGSDRCGGWVAMKGPGLKPIFELHALPLD
jgi:hypothetical protein